MYARLFAATSLLSVLVAVSACDNQPGKDKARATTGEATSATAAPVTTAAAAKYVFSNADSKVDWTGAKVTGKHDGTFKTFTGTIDVPDGKPESGTVTVDVDTKSLSVEPEKLAGHLKSADFFDVEKFPKATFQSTSIKAGGDKSATHTVTGNLTLHGVTKSISFPATIKVASDKADVDAEFVINRKDFALVYPGKPDDLIKDDVLLKLQIHAKKA